MGQKRRAKQHRREKKAATPPSERMEHGVVIGIHAALLGLVISGLIGYVLVIRGELDEIERKVITEASKINAIPVTPRLPVLDAEIDNLDHTGLRRRLTDIVVGLADVRDVDEAELHNQGSKMIEVMSAITHKYPFRHHYKDRMVIFADDAPLLAFTSVEQVKNWVDDLTSIVDSTHQLASRHPAKINRLVKAFQFGTPIVLAPGAQPTAEEKQDYEARLARNSTTALVQHFFSRMAQGGEIAEATTAELFQYELYRNRLPGKATVLIWTISCALAAFFGILLPMFKPRISHRLILWVPTLFYIAALANMLYTLLW